MQQVSLVNGLLKIVLARGPGCEPDITGKQALRTQLCTLQSL